MPIWDFQLSFYDGDDSFDLFNNLKKLFNHF